MLCMVKALLARAAWVTRTNFGDKPCGVLGISLGFEGLSRLRGGFSRPRKVLPKSINSSDGSRSPLSE